MIATSMRRLEVFLAVVETGRFSLAADQLGIAQPSVSAHIAGLERQVGQPLFLRNKGRPPSLSRAGRSLLTYATEVLRKSREAANALSGIKPGGPEELAIAAQRCIANHLLPPLLAEFLDRNPGIKIAVNSEIQENVLSLVNGGRADIGLFLGLRRVTGLTSEIVGHQSLAIVVSADHELAKRDRVAPDELQRFPFIGGLEGSNFARIVEMALRKVGVRDQRYVLRLQDATALVALARRGIGIHCTAFCNVEDDIRAGSLKQVALTVEPAALQIRLALRAVDTLPGSAQRFADFLRHSTSWKS